MKLRYILSFLAIVVAMTCSEHRQSPVSCMENSGYGKLFVFIGEKVEIRELNDEQDITDAKFSAKYKILERVCGDYNSDTIEFTVYDHYGRPAFEKFETVMLYVSEHEGKFYHQKYLYHSLYKTKDGRWASPYNRLDYFGAETLSGPFKLEKIAFAEEVSFDIAGLKTHVVREDYPKPFYNIVGTKAVAVYGNYVPQLFGLTKAGVLTARGLYGRKEDSEMIEGKEIELEHTEPVTLSYSEVRELTTVWQDLCSAIEKKQDQKIRSMSLDSVVCSVCEGFLEPDFYNDVESIDSFITTAYRNLPGTELWGLMKTGRFVLSAREQPSKMPKHYQQSSHAKPIIYELKFITYSDFAAYEYQHNHSFEFVKVNDKFKFYGMRSNWGSSTPISPNVLCERSVDMTKLFGSWQTSGMSNGRRSIYKLTFLKSGKCYSEKIGDTASKRRIPARFVINARDSTVSITTDKAKHRYKVLRLTHNCLEFTLEGENISNRYDRM